MMSIRLQRTGAHKAPKYRVVVKDSRTKRDGRFVEILGHYNPTTEPATVEIDAERYQARVAQGAVVSPTVKSLAKKAGIAG